MKYEVLSMKFLNVVGVGEGTRGDRRVALMIF